MNTLKTFLISDPLNFLEELAKVHDENNIDTAVMVDTEADKLYGTTRTIQFYCKEYDADHTYWVDMDNHRAIEADVITALSKLWTVWANAPYDFGALRTTTFKFDDVQQLGRLAYPRLGKSKRGFAVDNLIKHVTGIDAYAGLPKVELQKAGFKIGVELTEQQINYACSDVFYLYDLWADAKIQAMRNNYSYKIDMLALNLSVQYQQNGVLFHQPSLKLEKEKCELTLEEEELVLGDTNANSYKQVRERLQYPSSDSFALLDLAGGNPTAFSTRGIAFVEFLVAVHKECNKGIVKKQIDTYKDKMVAGMIKDADTILNSKLENGFNALEQFTIRHNNEHLRTYRLGEAKELLESVLWNTSDKLEVESLKSIPQIIKYLNSKNISAFPDSLNEWEASNFVYEMDIEDLKERSRFAKTVYDNRRTVKKYGYIKQYMLPVGDDREFKKMETFFNPYGAKTGRFTSNGKDEPKGQETTLNMQQIPRSLQYVTHQDSEDTVVVHADYSTAELRTACSLMADPVMYGYLKDGIDLHKVSATFAIDKKVEEINKEERQKGKAISFGLIFGMGITTFIEQSYKDYNVLFTEQEAGNIINKYMKTYKKVAKYIQTAWNEWDKKPAKSPSGRVSMADTGNAYINYSTQSSVGDITKLSLHYFSKDYPEVLGYIFNVVHDAIYLRVPKGTEALWAERLVKYMKKGYSEYIKFPMFTYKDIPQPVEVEYNDYSTGQAEYKCIEE